MSERQLPHLVCVVDDDLDLGGAVARLLSRNGYRTRAYQDPAEFLAMLPQEKADCIVTDIMMCDMDGFAFAEALRSADPAAAIVFMTAWPTTANAVDAVRTYGGLDYLEKPIDEGRLLKAVSEGVLWSGRRRAALLKLAKLTKREREVIELLGMGFSNKQIAGHLNLSPKTVEDHRANIVGKTGLVGMSQLIALLKDASDTLPERRSQDGHAYKAEEA